jgi:WhiB family transcriptional regulator, redox-sensing transcriptional regulator
MTRTSGQAREWQLKAACRGENSGAFYPPLRLELRRERRAREHVAKAICRECPVREECLEHALRFDERYGIWGGLTDVERRQLPRSA